MLVRLLASGLRPYRTQVVVVLGLLLGVSVSNLYLPNLTADIINNGVVKGDTAYIWRTGVLMLAITLVVSVIQIVSVVAAILDHGWHEWVIGPGRGWFIVPVHVIALAAIYWMTFVSILSATDYFLAFWKKLDHASTARRNRAASALLSRRKAAPTL